MKKTRGIAVLIVAAIMALTTIVFAACGSKTTQDGVSLLESRNRLVVIEATKTGGSLEDALKIFKEAGELDYSGSISEFGLYLTSVNGYEANASANEYWAIYSTLGEYGGVTYSNPEYGTYEYNGISCASASYGISGMPLVEGELYIITIATY